MSLRKLKKSFPEILDPDIIFLKTPSSSIQKTINFYPFHEQWWTTIYTWGELTEMLSKEHMIPPPNIDVDVTDDPCFCFI